MFLWVASFFSSIYQKNILYGKKGQLYNISRQKYNKQLELELRKIFAGDGIVFLPLTHHRCNATYMTTRMECQRQPVNAITFFSPCRSFVIFITDSYRPYLSTPRTIAYLRWSKHSVYLRMSFNSKLTIQI